MLEKEALERALDHVTCRAFKLKYDSYKIPCGWLFRIYDVFEDTSISVIVTEDEVYELSDEDAECIIKQFATPK